MIDGYHWYHRMYFGWREFHQVMPAIVFKNIRRKEDNYDGYIVGVSINCRILKNGKIINNN